MCVVDSFFGNGKQESAGPYLDVLPEVTAYPGLDHGPGVGFRGKRGARRVGRRCDVNRSQPTPQQRMVLSTQE